MTTILNSDKKKVFPSCILLVQLGLSFDQLSPLIIRNKNVHTLQPSCFFLSCLAHFASGQSEKPNRAT